MPNPLPNQIERNITKDNVIKYIWNLFPLKRNITKDNIIKYKVLRDIRTLFQPEEDYYKPIRIGF